MLKYPEFGFVSQSEVIELRRLQIAIANGGTSAPEIQMLSSLMGILRRRITDKTRGGNYQFYGYKEFANRLFIITQKGLDANIDIQSLFSNNSNEINEINKINKISPLELAVENEYILINQDLLESLKNSLLIADEIHNVYNILEKNNYGIAIQYVLDILKNEAPRVVFMSATPITGSAAEIIDLLNLLVPKEYLPNMKTLKRSDFFYNTAGLARRAFSDEVGDNVDSNEFGNNLKNKKLNANMNADLAQQITEFGENNIDEEFSKFIKNDTNDVNNTNDEFDDEFNKKTINKNDKTNIFKIKGMAIRINDLKENDTEIDQELSTFMVSQLKPLTLEKIAHLAAGRVSVLLDSDLESYPKRIFVGDNIINVPYLKFIICPMTKFHEQTLKYEHTNLENRLVEKASNSGLASNSYTLYDIAFPNPNLNSKIGLYKSIETPLSLIKASEEWKLENGIIVENGSNLGLISNTLVISGPFLHKDNIKQYSTKYYKLLEAVMDAITTGPGKIMIYHHRVRMSGVLLIQELLRMNGFIDNVTPPTDATICAICGIAKKEHEEHEDKKNKAKKEHNFIPARFIVAHSDIDRLSMVRNIASFNSISNLDGYQYRVIIGSKIIREGLNFKAIRYQFIMSLPTDFPTLLQVIGRTVRKDSHNDLSEEMRDVKIKIFLSTRKDDRISPELQRYINKGKEYLVIQEVERVLRIYAVDGFSNYSKILKVLENDNNNNDNDNNDNDNNNDNNNIKTLYTTIDSLPYKPISIPALEKELSITDLKVDTFNAFHSEREVYIITNICRILFQARPVWNYYDLWKELRSGNVKGVNYNYKLFDEGNFAIAINILSRPSGDPPKIVIQIDDYFILTEIKNKLVYPNLDIESYLREITPKNSIIKINLTDYLKEKKSEFAFDLYLKHFKNTYLLGSEPIELSLIDYNSIFHYTLIKKIIENNKLDLDKLSDANINKIINMYKRFKIIINIKGNMGYVASDLVMIYNNKEWNSISYLEAKISLTEENDIIIGFVVDDPISSTTKFKTRLPLHKIEISTDKKYDIRSLAKGAVCETRIRTDLYNYVNQLKAYTIKKNIFSKSHINLEKAYKDVKLKSDMALTSEHKLDFDKVNEINSNELNTDEINSNELNTNELNPNELIELNPNELIELNPNFKKHYAIKYDKSEKKRYPSASILCHTLKLYLLALEEYSKDNNLTDKWIYLFNDKIPSIQLHSM